MSAKEENVFVCNNIDTKVEITLHLFGDIMIRIFLSSYMVKSNSTPCR